MANFLSGLGRAIQGAGQTYLSVKEMERERKRQEEADERQRKLIDLQLAQAALAGLEPGAAVDDKTAELIRNSPLAGRLETTLQSTPFTPGADGSIARGATTGGRTIVKPTLEQEAELEQLGAAKDMRARRNALAAKYSQSDDPVLRRFGEAISAGVDMPPQPFSEKLSEAEKLGSVENKFALARINAQMAHYTYTRPQTPQERAHLQVFLSILRDNPIVEDDPTSPEAQEAFKQAQSVADFYVENMFGGGAGPGLPKIEPMINHERTRPKPAFNPRTSSIGPPRGMPSSHSFNPTKDPLGILK